MTLQMKEHDTLDRKLLTYSNSSCPMGTYGAKNTWKSGFSAGQNSVAARDAIVLARDAIDLAATLSLSPATLSCSPVK